MTMLQPLPPHLHSTAMRFGAKRNPGKPRPPQISVWTPPYYDPKIFAQDPDSKSKKLATSLFNTYNQRAPVVKAVAERLQKELARRNAPDATLYPCPNPKAVNDITIEIPLGPGKSVKAQKAAAAVQQQKMLETLRRVPGMAVSDDGKLSIYVYRKKPYQVHVVIALTEEEALRLETFA